MSQPIKSNKENKDIKSTKKSNLINRIRKIEKITKKINLTQMKFTKKIEAKIKEMEKQIESITKIDMNENYIEQEESNDFPKVKVEETKVEEKVCVNEKCKITDLIKVDMQDKKELKFEEITKEEILQNPIIKIEEFATVTDDDYILESISKITKLEDEDEEEEGK